jgi:KipI family sensor histidine kinase inhibitor
MKLSRIGENSIAFSVSHDRTAECVREIHALQLQIQSKQLPGLISMYPGLDTLVLRFRDLTQDMIRHLESIEWNATSKITQSSTQPARIPVCYEKEFAIDIAAVSNTTGLSHQDIADLHKSVIYEVWMLGFMPGFPYLGELPVKLQVPRKKSPDASIPAGSVAIAEEYSGIYPVKSPGGWNIIGRTPVSILDYKRDKPWLLEYGERVQFYPITSTEFSRWSNEHETKNH